ncbi:hypothetical protein WJX72_007264 [[Myrmecia] bisecta]|uniref:NAD(P)-binding domain-containing protein n=1 Tax=[Myrmecia] bisecta TaxID=41462 RepID=A0AAW1Q7J6_9CHLO
MLPKVLSSPTAQKLAHASFSSSRPFASRVSTQPSFPRTTPVCAYAASLPHRGYSTGDKPHPLDSNPNVESPLRPETSAGTQQEQPGGSSGLPRLVVFGGNGFVGSRVCEQALKTGLSVVSISRSGRPKALAGAAWADSIDWVQADAFEPATYRDQLQGAVGVVSCLGGFGSNEQMFKICGEANITAINEAAEAGVGRFVFISVHDYRFPGFFLSGYFQGKRKAENALAAKFPEGGVALRPGFIHGTRSVGSVGIPLGLVGTPLEKALGFLPTKTLASVPLLGAGFVPPVSVTAVAKAAVAAATDPSVPGGIMDVWEIAQLDATSG